MAGVHRDLEELQTSYSAFETEKLQDPDDDEDAPPRFQQQSPARPAFWLQGSGMPRQTGASQAKEHGDQDHPPGGVIIHTVPEESKSRWSHIDDLDSFFKNVYTYHQKSGFKVMLVQRTSELLQVLFILFFTVYLANCVNYDVLFNNKLADGKKFGEKITISDVASPPGECMSKMSPMTCVFLLIGMSFWIVKMLAIFYQFFQFWDIKNFFSQALHIDESELESVTWRDVQSRLVSAQKDHLMCIHKEQLTDLDIYHRILRFKNYLVAMVNKDILPMRISPLPCLPSFVFFSHSLKFNLEWLFFKGPWAAFDKWHLKEDYKKLSKKAELTSNLKNRIVILAFINFILMPLIFFWQLLYCFFNYADLIKREPGSLGVRKWSQYGKLYLRHLNELDHEFKSRLNRAYKPANQYMEIFVSPMSAVIARFFAFLSGSILAVFILLSVWDEDVLNVEHALTVMTALGGIVAVCRLFLPDENMVFCPERTLTAVIAHIHYFPIDNWKGRAHTYEVMSHLNELFPYTALTLVEELLSPIITPFVLLFLLRPRAHSIIDFFRNFTVDVVGVGDVCSFAQLDVRRHGNPNWQQAAAPRVSPEPGCEDDEVEETCKIDANSYTQGEAGKTEMSLINFTLANPNWRPPPEAADFINNLRQHASNQVDVLPSLSEEKLENNPLYSSLTALENVGGVYAEIAQDLLQSTTGPAVAAHHNIGASSSRRGFESSSSQWSSPLRRRGSSSNASLNQSSASMVRSIIQATDDRHSNTVTGIPPPPNLQRDLKRLGLEYTGADMSLSALFMHELHHKSTSSNNKNYGGGGHNLATNTNYTNSTIITKRHQNHHPVESISEEECIPLVSHSGLDHLA
jgi:autophagy-related protein 9